MCGKGLGVLFVGDHPVGLKDEIGKDMGEEEGGEGFRHGAPPELSEGPTRFLTAEGNLLHSAETARLVG